MLKLKSFPPYPEKTPELETVPLPADLPAPVSRFYKTILGGRVPVVESAVITGRAKMRIGGLPFPSRFRFIHLAGRDYRHYIEAAVLGIPVMKVNEWYLDGKSRMDLPFGVVENEPKVDSAANLGLWAESLWLPSIYITDPRVRWQAINETNARLIVPFGDEEDAFMATFDPGTGLLESLEALRYRDASDPEKIPWRDDILGWKRFHGMQVPSPASATWLDQGKPWAIFEVEDVAYNVDVNDYVRATGL